MKKLFTLMLLLIAAGTSAQKARQRHKPVEPITYTNTNNIVIRGDSINGGEEPCITLNNCNNVRITHCFLGNSTKVGIYLYNCANIKIDSVYITNVSTGVYAVDSYAISVTHIQAKNMVGPYPRGAFVQFNNVSGPRCRVNYNKFENILGQCHAEDAINMYKSNGAARDPIQIIGNKIRGGGPSKTGGGIMLGDNGGSYQVASHNILVNPGQYGMAISGGHNLVISNNEIYSKPQIFTNVGLYIWAQLNYACSLNEISHNQVNWKNKDGDQNDTWDQGNCGEVTGWKTNNILSKLEESILPQQLLTTSGY